MSEVDESFEEKYDEWLWHEDVEEKRTQGEIREMVIATLIRSVKEQVEELNREIAEYYASHWRDDDSPIAESTLGVRRVYQFTKGANRCTLAV